MRCEVHNRAAANGAARLFTFDSGKLQALTDIARQVRMRLLGPAHYLLFCAIIARIP
jgi:hypothetical protein